MTVRTTGLLSVLVLVLGLLLWRDRPAPRPPPVPAPGPVLPFSVEDVILAGIRTATGGFECVRTEGNWFLTRPIAARADPAAMDCILVSLEQLPIRERLLPGDLEKRGLAPSDYGLEPPAAVITLGTQREKRLLEVGERSPLGDAIYVRWRDQPEIFATSTGLLDLVRTAPEAIRDRRLVRAEESAVVRLELKAAGRPLIQLAREGQAWTLQKPSPARADARRVHELLARVLRIEARAFVSETMADPMAYGIGDDEAALQIGLGFARGGQSERLVFGKPLADQPDLVYASVRGGNAVLAVDRGEVESLSIRPEDVRDRRLPLPPLDQVRAIRLQRGESLLSLVRGPGAQWWILEPARWPADEERVESLLRYLGGIRVQAFWPAAGSLAPAVDMNRPAGRLCLSTAKVLSGSGQDPADVFCLRWQDWGGSNRFVAVCGEADEYLELPSGVERVLGVEPLWFRDLTVMALDPAAVRRITLRAAGVLQAVDRGDRGEWRAAPVSPGMVDADFARDILAWAATLRAIRLALEPESEGAEAEWRAPRLSITFGLTGEGGIQKTLHLGAETPDGGVRAKVQGQDTVFVLERTMPLRLFQGGLVRPEPD